jgi:hypothetical protein
MRIETSSRVTRDRAGIHGVRGTLTFTAAADGHAGVYHFATHGLSPEDMRAEVARVSAHHAEVARRHAAFETLRGQTFGAWTVTDCAIRMRGTNVELHVGLLSATESIEMREIYGTAADVPNVAQITRMVRDAAIARTNKQQIERDHVNTVRQVLGVEG